jgi:hypothetical protein
MMKAFKIVAVALIATFAMGHGVMSFAQAPTISGKLSKESIEVGDRFEYIVDIEADRATPIHTQIFHKPMSDQEAEALAKSKRSMSSYTEYNEDVLELIKEYPIDTVKVDGRRLHLRKRYLLAAMETGDIPLVPAVMYYEKNRDVPDTLFSRDTLRLHVAGFEELDTTLFLRYDPASQQGVVVDSVMAMSKLRDTGLYKQKDLPFIFAEIRDYVIYAAIGVILFGLLVWLAVWLVLRFIKSRKAKPRKMPEIPPHIVANKALTELGHRKLWQKGKFKLYYSELTDILRVYISGRWGVGAMEMTSDEIVMALRDIDMPTNSRSDLITILRTADMVKFAKAEPEAEINEENLNRALYFVENTKVISLKGYEGKEEINSETNIKD